MRVLMGPAFISATGQRVAEYAFENVADERWDKVIATNLTSVFSSIRAAVPHMKKNREGGRIIVTTSIAGIRPEAIVGMPYMPAKAGAGHLVRQAALELAKYNVLVNAIAPGPFVTNIAGGHMQKPEVRKAFERWVPLGRAAETKDDSGDRSVPGVAGLKVRDRHRNRHRWRLPGGHRRLTLRALERVRDLCCVFG